MKMFIVFKKKSLINFIIILIILVLLFWYFTIKTSKTFAIKLSYNSIISDEFSVKIKNLINQEEKIAYLTFDDGPTKITSKVLEILKNENVKATFFVIGKCVDEYPEIVRRAYEEGHYIANHGYDHDNSILYKNEESFINEIKKTDVAIGKAIGVDNYCSHVFRFPNGFSSMQYKIQKEKMSKLLSKISYTYIDWNCLNNDSVKKYTNEQLLDNLKKSSKNKNTLVILMHDTNYVSNSSEILKESIDYLKSEGYEFRNFYDFLDYQ